MDTIELIELLSIKFSREDAEKIALHFSEQADYNTSELVNIWSKVFDRCDAERIVDLYTINKQIY